MIQSTIYKLVTGVTDTKIIDFLKKKGEKRTPGNIVNSVISEDSSKKDPLFYGLNLKKKRRKTIFFIKIFKRKD